MLLFFSKCFLLLLWKTHQVFLTQEFRDSKNRKEEEFKKKKDTKKDQKKKKTVEERRLGETHNTHLLREDDRRPENDDQNDDGHGGGRKENHHHHHDPPWRRFGRRRRPSRDDEARLFWCRRFCGAGERRRPHVMKSSEVDRGGVDTARTALPRTMSRGADREGFHAMAGEMARGAVRCSIIRLLFSKERSRRRHRPKPNRTNRRR